MAPQSKLCWLKAVFFTTLSLFFSGAAIAQQERDSCQTAGVYKVLVLDRKGVPVSGAQVRLLSLERNLQMTVLAEGSTVQGEVWFSTHALSFIVQVMAKPGSPSQDYLSGFFSSKQAFVQTPTSATTIENTCEGDTVEIRYSMWHKTQNPNIQRSGAIGGPPPKATAPRRPAGDAAPASGEPNRSDPGDPISGIKVLGKGRNSRNEENNER